MLQYYKEVWKPLNKRYEISSYGNFRRIYKSKSRKLNPYRKGSKLAISLNLENEIKEYNVAKLVAETFIRPLKENEVVHHKNLVISDNNIINLKIITKSEAGKITGILSKQKTICLLNDEGDILKTFKGTREAGSKLFISRQTVSDYCNNRIKNKMFNIVWADDLI